MSIAVPAITAPALTQPPALEPRTRLLLQGSIIPTLLRLAWPNVLVMLAQASTGLIETWWVSRLGTDALAGMALVFPVFMMMQMLSAGAMGGGISSAIARASGGGRHADALVLHAIVINLLLGLTFSVLVLAFGRSLYGALGGEGESLEAALLYSNVVFAGVGLVWLMNAFASVIRGTGNMLVPSLAVCIGVVLLVPLSPVLIFGFGPIPALGIAGAGIAVILSTALTSAVLAWYVGSGRSLVRMVFVRLRPILFGDILRVGAVGSISTLQTTLTVALTTALVGAAAGPDAIAGYGTGARLEYLLIPLVFGLGAPLVALVGTTSVRASGRERSASRSSGARSPLGSPKRSAWPPRSGHTPGSGCSAAIRACWIPAPPTCAAWGQLTGSSALACRSTSPHKEPPGSSGRSSRGCCACSSRSVADGSSCV